MLTELGTPDRVRAETAVPACTAHSRRASPSSNSVKGRWMWPPKTRSAPAAAQARVACAWPRSRLRRSLASGTATAVVVHTGARAVFGGIAESMSGERVATSFEHHHINKQIVEELAADEA